MKNVELSDRQITMLIELYMKSIAECKEAMDHLYDGFLSGKISRDKYRPKMRHWEDEFFNAQLELQLLRSYIN